MSSPSIFSCGNCPTRCPAIVAAELPAGLLGQLDDVGEQLLAGDVRIGLEERPAGVPHDRQRVAQPVLDRVVAEHEGAAEVGLPLPRRSARSRRRRCRRRSIDPVGRVLAVGLQGVRAGSHDPLVPVPVDAEQVGGQVADRVAGLRPRSRPAAISARSSTAANSSTALACASSRLGGPDVLVVDQIAHRDHASTGT